MLLCFDFTYRVEAGAAPEKVKQYKYKVKNIYPHSTESFTQGLVYQHGILYESTGLYGRSKLLKLNIKTGRPIARRDLSAKFFGEGLTVVGDTLVQLTYRSGTGFVYNKKNLEIINTFSYPMEGWGLTYDGEHLIISDGTSNLYYFNPIDYKPVNVITVKKNGTPLNKLNELEYINGYVFANIWKSEIIVQIDPVTGLVVGEIDLGELSRQNKRSSEGVLNGVAFDHERQTMLVTGKLWPRLYEIQLSPEIK